MDDCMGCAFDEQFEGMCPYAEWTAHSTCSMFTPIVEDDEEEEQEEG